MFLDSEIDHFPFHEWRKQRLTWLKTVPRILGDTGDHNSVEGLIDLIEYTQPKSVLEIGSSRGVSTEVFCLYCQNVIAVDAWEDQEENGVLIKWSQFKDEFDKRLKDYPNLEVVKGKSPSIFVDIGLCTVVVDLVYIDGNHEKEAFEKDFGFVKNILEPKWIAGHDYNQVKDYMPTPDKVFKDTSWCIKI